MCVLITGGCGLIGSNVAKILAGNNIKCILFDQNTFLWDYLEPLSGEIELVSGDICDHDQISNLCHSRKVNGIIHLASNKYEKDCRANLINSFNINVSSTMNLLKTAKELNMQRFLFASTAALFGRWKNENVAIKEEDIPSPTGFYSTYKFTSELLLKNFKHIFNLPAASFRISRVYGPGVVHAEPESNPIRTLAFKCVFEDEVKEDSGLDFKADFSFVEDIARGIFMLFTSKKLKYDIYHLGGGKLYKVKDVVDILKKTFPQKNIEVGSGTLPYSGQAPIRGPLNIERAKHEIDFKVAHSLEQGIEKYLMWLKKQKINVA